MTRLGNSKLKNVFLETDYENSNPGSDNVCVDDQGVFNIVQHLEKNAPEGYSFHLNTAFINENAIPSRVSLCIKWGEAEFAFCRDYMYIGYDSGAQWRMLSTPCKADISEFDIVVPPGRHLLCCTPKFDNNDYDKLLNKYREESFIDVVDTAKTPEGRNICCLKLGNAKGKKFVISTRAHAYETAGAYCISGLLEDLIKNHSKYVDFLEQFQLYVFPMINPDAVAAGNCCLSTSGVNFGNSIVTEESYQQDCAVKNLCTFIFDLKPDYYLDMHNNTGPHLGDCFRSHDNNILKAFAAAAPDMSRHQKIWHCQKVDYKKAYIFAKCREQFSTKYMLTEFPWYTRTPEEMKQMGVEFFTSLFKVIQETS